jgi:hypothetical protein
MDHPIDLNKRTADYIRLRDEIKRLDDDHKAKMAPYREALDQLNGLLLNHLNTIAGDSVATASGTVYRTTKKSASIADKAAFWAYVVATGDWDLVDYKANATNVEEHATKNGSLPPGVNLTSRQEVGVRRK